ncbi:MAG TPA: hypothetical protein VM755_01585 [Stellaceae bacterium]|nr:hypothetical protein [Stellaceae bacterium]
MRKTAFTLAVALTMICARADFARAMGATGGEMLGTTTAGVSGYVGGGNPNVSPPLAPAGAAGLPLGKAPPTSQTPAPGAAAVPPAIPAPLPCSNGAPPCR